jgi:Niemann-Pick C1 protein
MDEIVDFVDKNADKFSADPFADSWIYVYTFQFKIIPSSLLMNFILVIVAVLITSPLVLRQPMAVLQLVFTIILIDVELFGCVYAFNLQVNSFSALSLIMAVGLVVDYNAHITHAFFVTDPEDTKVERMRIAMSQMGRSVFMGGITSLLGLVPLAFSSCEVFRVFFKMTLAIVVLGLVHGIVLGPVILMTIPFKTPPGEFEAHKKWLGIKAEKISEKMKSKRDSRTKSVDAEKEAAISNNDI